MKTRGLWLWLALILAAALWSACSGDKDKEAAAQTPVKIGPRLQVEAPVFDFGKVAARARLQHDYVLTNTGDEPLHLTKTHQDGNCDPESRWAGKIIAPGASLTLPVFFPSGTTEGKQECRITADFDDPAHPQVEFLLSATTEAAVDFKPKEIRAFRVDPNQGEQITLMITNARTTPLTITSVTAENSAVTIEIPLGVTLPFRLGPGEATSVTVNIRPGSGFNRIETKVVVELAEYPGSKIEVPLTAARRN